jgi:hypothetical protein
VLVSGDVHYLLHRWLIKSHSCLLCEQSGHHQYDQGKCYGLFGKQHPSELRVSWCYRDPHVHIFERDGRSFEACNRYSAHEKNGDTGRSCRCSLVSVLLSSVLHPRTRTARRWWLHYQLSTLSELQCHCINFLETITTCFVLFAFIWCLYIFTCTQEDTQTDIFQAAQSLWESTLFWNVASPSCFQSFAVSHACPASNIFCSCQSPPTSCIPTGK